MKTQAMKIKDDEQIAIDNDIMSSEQQLDNLDKSIEYQIISLITNPYIQSQFNNPKPIINSQSQTIPNIKVQKSQLIGRPEVDTGKQISSNELQNQNIQSPSTQQQFGQYQNSQKQKQQYQEGFYNSQNQQPNSQENHQQENQYDLDPENQNSISQKDHQKKNQDIENPQNQQPKSDDIQLNPQNDHQLQNSTFKNTENQQQISQQQQNQGRNNSTNQKNQSYEVQEGKRTVMSPKQQNQPLLQGQKMKTIDKQQQQEVQYYVYADLKNFLGILTDVNETLKFFDGTQDAAYVPVAINRLILQSNLSNGIHFDCQHNFQSDYQKQLYQQEKQNALKILKESVEKMQIPKNYKIHECINRYEETLGKNTEMKTIEPLKVEHRGDFNQEALRKIIGGIQEVDKQLQDVSKGIYQKPEKEDLYKNLNERKQIAQEKLAQQYPQVAKQNKQKLNQTKQTLYNNIK